MNNFLKELIRLSERLGSVRGYDAAETIDDITNLYNKHVEELTEPEYDYSLTPEEEKAMEEHLVFHSGSNPAFKTGQDIGLPAVNLPGKEEFQNTKGMKYKQFKKALKLAKQITKNYLKLERQFALDAYENPLMNTLEFSDLLDLLFESHYGHEGRELVDWWIYETHYGKKLDEEVDISSTKELWCCLESNKINVNL